VRHAVRADRLAPKRTTGTPNACRRDAMFGECTARIVFPLAASEHCLPW
jgi:hypothetical protein